MNSLESLPAAGGDYVLVIKINRGSTLEVGQIGSIDFSTGWALYMGSARGPGGLRARLIRHAQPSQHKRTHWHIDYLISAAPIHELWWTSSEIRFECRWADLAAEIGQAIPSFGASDCRCGSHLFTLQNHILVEHAWARLYQDCQGRLHRKHIHQETV